MVVLHFLRLLAQAGSAPPACALDAADAAIAASLGLDASDLGLDNVTAVSGSACAPALQSLLASRCVAAVPLLNVDGYAYNVAQGPLGARMKRKNGRPTTCRSAEDGGVDPNRNYAVCFHRDAAGSSSDPCDEVRARRHSQLRPPHGRPPVPDPRPPSPGRRSRGRLRSPSPSPAPCSRCGRCLTAARSRGPRPSPTTPTGTPRARRWGGAARARPAAAHGGRRSRFVNIPHACRPLGPVAGARGRDYARVAAAVTVANGYGWGQPWTTVRWDGELRDAPTPTSGAPSPTPTLLAAAAAAAAACCRRRRRPSPPTHAG